jgi:hypothetical protein
MKYASAGPFFEAVTEKHSLVSSAPLPLRCQRLHGASTGKYVVVTRMPMPTAAIEENPMMWPIGLSSRTVVIRPVATRRSTQANHSCGRYVFVFFTLIAATVPSLVV